MWFIQRQSSQVFLLLVLTYQFSHAFPSRNSPNSHARASAQRRLEAPTCGLNQRFHKETSKCYPLDDQGPCGENMRFIEDPHDKLDGKCECVDHIMGCEYWPFTYWPAERKCYPLFGQGPCPEGEWLVNEHEGRHRRRTKNSGSRRNAEIHGVCKPRTCPDGTQGKTLVSHKGACYMTNSQGFCSTAQERLFFAKGSAEPKCFIRPGHQSKPCPAAPLGGGTIQEIVVITPKPALSPVLPPAERQISSVTPVTSSSTTTTTLTPKALGRSGDIDCSEGQVPTEDGGCTTLALFGK